MSQTVEVDLKNIPHEYSITIGSNLLEKSGRWGRKNLPKQTQKVVIITNPKIYNLYGEEVLKSFRVADIDCTVYRIGDGERFKNFHTLEKTIKFLSKENLKRSDAVVALGGGVVGDLAGFAAAIYLRGINFLQIPTTLLAMIDSSVGGKTGINTSFGKNLLGVFHRPAGVLVDIDVLKTLARREITAGFCEAVKHGAIGSQNLFTKTKNFLLEYPVSDFDTYFSDKEFLRKLASLIALQISYKAEIVGNDQYEDIFRNDKYSRKVLNFGHTIGHALEKITNYRYFKHGEAIGYGMLAAAELSKNVANLPESEIKSLREAVALTGKLPSCKNINFETLFEALSFDKKNIGKSLQWILLKKIGEPKIVKSAEIPESIIRESIKKIISQS